MWLVCYTHELLTHVRPRKNIFINGHFHQFLKATMDTAPNLNCKLSAHWNSAAFFTLGEPWGYTEMSAGTKCTSKQVSNNHHHHYYCYCFCLLIYFLQCCCALFCIVALIFICNTSCFCREANNHLIYVKNSPVSRLIDIMLDYVFFLQ